MKGRHPLFTFLGDVVSRAEPWPLPNHFAAVYTAVTLIGAGIAGGLI